MLIVASTITLAATTPMAPCITPNNTAAGNSTAVLTAASRPPRPDGDEKRCQRQPDDNLPPDSKFRQITNAAAAYIATAPSSTKN